MHEPTRMTVRVTDAEADDEHLEDLTRRLREELLNLDVPVEAASAAQAPSGAKAVVELAALGTLVVTLSQSPVLAAIINAVSQWLGQRRNRTVRMDIGGDVLELSGMPAGEQRHLVDAWLRRHQGAAASVRPGRHALIVASYDYQDQGLRRLRAPAHDAERLARVLRDPAIGGFDVQTVVNESAPVINETVEGFFAERAPEDLLLLYFSGHGVKDEAGELYFAAAPTRRNRLAATAVAADFVNRRMNRSRSRRIVLLLDCCYAGAFGRGLVARGSAIALEEQFGGRGRAVITASSAMEYAFEGDRLTGDDAGPSVFTSALVEGLETGEADRDQDGYIGLDELYDYIHDRVTRVTPNQTPGKWTFDLQGELHIAHRGTPVTVASPLPHGLQEAVDHQLAGVRAGAVTELGRLMRGAHAGVALAAKLALQRLSNDDSRTVSAAAAAALADAPETRPTPPTPPAVAPEAPPAPLAPPPPPPPQPALPQQPAMPQAPPTSQQAAAQMPASPPTAPLPSAAPPSPAPQTRPASPSGATHSKPINGLAVAAFATAMLTALAAITVPIALFLSPITVIAGHIARRQIRHKAEAGNALALIGLIIGYVGIGFIVFLLVRA